MDINCRKLNCKYNNKCVCMAKGVGIACSTVCDTYEEDTEKEVHDITKTMFQKTPKYENFRHIKKANIECCAPCMFNKSGKCVANGIIVLTGAKNPICGTYLCDGRCREKAQPIKKDENIAKRTTKIKNEKCGGKLSQ